MLVLLGMVEDARLQAWRCLAGGLLAGAAAGVKLTALGFGIGAGLALLLCWCARWPVRLAGLVLFGLASFGLAVIAGPWWLHLYQVYGNPLFPYFNGVLAYLLSTPVNIADRRFLPPRLGAGAVLSILLGGAAPEFLVIELPTRDPRFLPAYVALAVLAVQACVRRWRPGRETAFLAVFFVASFILWEAQFANRAPRPARTASRRGPLAAATGVAGPQELVPGSRPGGDFA